MAGRSSADALRGLSRKEKIAGWIYLPFYLFVFRFGLPFLPKLGISLSGFETNCVFYAVNLIAVLLIFHRFLRQSFFGDGFWDFLQAFVLGAVFYFALSWLLQFALSLLKFRAEAYNNASVWAMFSENRIIMMLISFAAAPLIEETLFRGFVFSTLRHTSRVLAYILSAALFAFVHVWSYYPAHELGELIVSGVLYLPVSVCLAWTYEKSGTIWAPILLHAALNCATYFGFSLF